MKRNYKTLLIIFSVILVVILIACLIAFVLNNKNTDNSSSTYIEEWEKEILCNLLIDPTPTQLENIDKGNLDATQESYLKGLRNLTKYLKEKYPSYDCTILEITRQGLFLEDTIYYFSVSGFSGKYEAMLKNDNSFCDNFYFELYSLEYNNDLKSEIEKSNKNIIAINTDFTSYTGMEAKEGLNMDDLKKLKLPCIISLYVNVDTDNELEELKNIIKKLDLYGSYTIYNSALFQHGMTSVECKDTWSNNRENIKYITFNSWD